MNIEDTTTYYVAIIPTKIDGIYDEFGVDIMHIEIDCDGEVVSAGPELWISADPADYYISEHKYFMAENDFTSVEDVATELLYENGWRIEGTWTVTNYGAWMEAHVINNKLEKMN